MRGNLAQGALALIALIPGACNSGDIDKRSLRSSAQISVQAGKDNRELDAYLQVIRDESGQVVSLSGLRTNSVLSDQDQSTNALMEHAELPIFEYTPPEGANALYSKPIPVQDAMKLNLVASGKAGDQNGTEAICSKLETSAFYVLPPKFADLPKEGGDFFSCIQIKTPGGALAFIDTPKFSVKRNPAAITDTSVTTTESGTGLEVDAMARGAAGEKSGSIPASAPVLPQPRNPSISINGGTRFTNTLSVTLLLFAEHATEMHITNTEGCGNDGTWEPYLLSKIWVFNTKNATLDVFAKFRNAPDNESRCVSASIIHDDLAPKDLALTINGGARFALSANTTLQIAATDAATMAIFDDKDCSGDSTWVPFATEMPWQLKKMNAENSISAKFRDRAGNESLCVSATIIQDANPPADGMVEINSGAAYTSSREVILTLGVTNPAQMYLTNTRGCNSGGEWQEFVATQPWTLGGANARVYVFAKFRNTIGQETPCTSASITHDSIRPVAQSVSVNGGFGYTKRSQVTLGLAATGADSMFITNNADCQNDGVWERYTASRPWTLQQTNALALVYVKFRDYAGNETEGCSSGSIVHDSIVPVVGRGFAIAVGAQYTGSTAVTLTIPAISDRNSPVLMNISNGSSCNGSDVWEPLVTSKVWNLPAVDGVATVGIKFKDRAENQTACTFKSITLDITRPSLPVLNPLPDLTNRPSIDVAFSSSSDTNFSTHEVMACTDRACSLGCTQPVASVTSPVNIGPLADTTFYYACVRGNDLAGNSSVWVSSETPVRVDFAAPNVTVNYGDDYTQNNSVRVSYIFDDSRVTAICLREDTNVAACTWDGDITSPNTFIITGSEGIVTVYGWLRNDANDVISMAGDTIVFDITRPTNPVVEDPPSTSANSAVTFAWTGGSDVNLKGYNLAACTGADCITGCIGATLVSSSPKVVRGLLTDRYHACVQAQDKAGNVSDWIASASMVAVSAIEVSGYITSPNSTVGSQNSASATADTTFGWQTNTSGISLANNGYTFTVENGNGNALNYSGIVSGSGAFVLSAEAWWTNNHGTGSHLIISGSTSNTYTGETRIDRGNIRLQKTNGAIALTGDIIVGMASLDDDARLIWYGSAQVDPAANITVSNRTNNYLDLNGNTQSINGLILGSNTYVATGTSGVLTVRSLRYDGADYKVGLYTNASPFVSGSGYVRVTCPDSGYTIVPGSTDLGVSSFCVMTYEAKAWNDSNRNSVVDRNEIDENGCQEYHCSTSNWGVSAFKPVSTWRGRPWRKVSIENARTLCQALGPNYDLISNAEWMTIARNVEGMNENWSGGTSGAGCLFQGNNGTISSCSYNGGNPESGPERNVKAKLILNNNEVIWDFAGNVSEWTNWHLGRDSLASAPTTCTTTTTELPQVGCAGLLPNDYNTSTGNYSSSSGIGMFMGGSGSEGIAYRGGSWSDEQMSGAYALKLNQSLSSTNSQIGFRCVYRP